ncbi:MAG TPA: efflux RND transporter periplasmic adaptor subunit [Bryobacteraceae bacterium]|nr:efflux RND transporter periplasmic adaptor subunit [Bryobacteraceae bacterium]
MRLRVVLLLLATAALGGLIWALVHWKRQPPEIPFAKVARETIVSSVSTNGKVEPIEWATARAERAGPVGAILIERGRTVQQDAPLVEIDASDAKADLASAQSRMEQARAELAVFDKGGRATDLADISSGIEKAKLELETAQKDCDVLTRLQAKDAATRQEVALARQRIDAAQAQIHSLEQKRSALVAAPDRSAAMARLHDAEAAARLAEQRLKQSVVRAPVAGVVYQFDLKRGAYLNPGDPVASIGELERVRVNVYVDEPDLGRVTRGLPVSITWDALPGRSWTGVVDKTPTQVEALGTRQVGQVACIINNPDRDLLPGTNVNAEIKAESAQNALTIPREAIRRELGQAGVFVLNGDRVAWKKITMGIGNTTRAQVDGLNEGDSIALPTEKPLKDGMLVRPAFP